MRMLTAALFAALSLSACAATPPDGPAQSLTLNATQQTNLRTLLGLSPSSPFTVGVLDEDANRQLSAGDIAIIYGGIANAETSRRTLNQTDVTTINAPHPNPLAEAARQLRDAEAKWKQNRPAHYTYTLQRSCFCAPEYRKPIEIRVFRGLIQQASLLPEGTPLPAERKSEALTVDGLFRLIREAIDKKAASVTVEYDAQYGFPTNISIDHDQMMADEETYMTASHFRVASGLKPKQTGQTMCTMDAQMCPDGVTFVGRSGPNCEFAACPK
ncbi:MAG: hypothetical protein KJ914_12020 [Gammaproteobacteria bacterium]|nr:hypothetical protein [Gammaproteobacteria bacterium]MBU1722506.1 hypothetical protein [Gammaproteobacteria bacterium]MBU2007027.1 hypothetical protein [Gammaproteobacteria bacterium]